VPGGPVAQGSGTVRHEQGTATVHLPQTLTSPSGSDVNDPLPDP
jgi:hypothetical protein